MDIPIQGVHAVLPVTPRTAGNTQVFTIPRQYQGHRLLLIVLEEHTENAPTCHPAAQADTKRTQTTTSATPAAVKPIRPAPGVEFASNGDPLPTENSTKTTPNNPQRQETTKETHPHTAPCGEPFRTQTGLNQHIDTCIPCSEAITEA